MKDVCKEAGVEKKYTNHSLRATGATRLFQSGTPENVIMERSGHRSLDGVRQYERVSQDQHIAAQAILNVTDGYKSFDSEVKEAQKRIKSRPSPRKKQPLAEIQTAQQSVTIDAPVKPEPGDYLKENKLLSLLPPMEGSDRVVHLKFENCTFHF